MFMAQRKFISLTTVLLVSLLVPTRCSSIERVGSHPLDTNHVIVIRHLRADFERPSNFGYSSILISSDNGKQTGWVLISAPTGNSMQVYKDVDYPGVLWRCSLGSSVGEKETCIVLPIDPVEAKVGKLLCAGNRCRNERRYDGWFGMTLIGNADRIIACTPKWKRGFKNDNYKLNGLCYWLPTELLVSEEFLADNYDYTVQRLIPLVNQPLQVVDRFPVWAWAQAGFSAHLTRDNELFLGAPGVNGWNGSLIRYQDNWSPDPGTRERINRKNQTEFSQYSVLQTDMPQIFYNLEYFGFAVTQGNYFTLPDDSEFSETMVAASSPRGSILLGIVLIFEFPENENDLWLPFHTVQGDQFGAYFGYALLSEDLNGDGLDELIVGAPFRSAVQPKGEANGQDADESSRKNFQVRDEGCVFVYTSKEKLDLFSDPEIMCGSTSFGARFGSSIASLGDINSDGFKDIAISAPFENDSEGAIYIYHGRASFGVNKRTSILPDLKLSPSDLQLSLRGFGGSLFGGVDIDDNSRPDLLIGSYLSEVVVILRTRPKIHFESKVEALLNGIILEKLKRDVSEFNIRSCIRILKAKLKKPFSSDKIFDISMKLEVDPKLGRFEILGSMANTSEGNHTFFNRTIDQKVRIRAQEVVCPEWNVGILEGVDLEIAGSTPFNIQLDIIYEEAVHRSRSSRNYNILYGLEMELNGAEFDDFCSKCPSRTVVTTEFNLPIALDNCDADDDPRCTSDLRLNVSWQMTSLDHTTIGYAIGSDFSLNIIIRLRNHEAAETAYFPVVDLKSESFDLLPEDHPGCNYVPEKTDLKGTILECRLGSMLQPNETKTLILPMKTTDIFAKRKNYTLQFTVTAYPGKDSLAVKTTKQLGISLIATVDGNFFGSAQNTTFSNEKYTKIEHTFKVTLTGQSPVEHIRTTLWFPIKKMVAKTDQQILFILQPPQDTPSTCRVTSKNGKFSVAEKLIIERGGSHRTHRGASQHDSPEKRSQTPINFAQIGTERRGIFQKHLVQELRCENSEDPNCLRVECDSKKIPVNSTIEIEFRIYISNNLTRQLMLKNDRPILHIQTVGRVRILEDEEAQFGTADTFVHDYSIEAEEPIGVWIYIISGILGVLLLALLIFLLIRCGFFQRALKRKWDAMKSSKGPVMEEPELWGRWQYSQIYHPPT